MKRNDLIDSYIGEYQERIRRLRKGYKHLDLKDKRLVSALNYAYQEFIQALRRIRDENQ